MHLMQKCIFATRTFYEVKCSASHFPKENVQLCKNAFDAKMRFLLCKKQRCCAKMHLMQKCIFAYILRSKMFSITFCFAKMHFCINKMLQMHLMLCKNIFLHHILFCKNAFLHQQNVTNAFDAALTFCLQNVRKRQNAFWRTFSKGKCSAYIFQRKMFSVHFPKENVQLCKNAFDA